MVDQVADTSTVLRIILEALAEEVETVWTQVKRLVYLIVTVSYALDDLTFSLTIKWE